MKWIGQLWRGEFTLRRAFWIFGVLVPILWFFASKFLSMAVMLFMLFVGFAGPSAPNGLLAGGLFGIVAMMVVTLAYQTIAGVGIWRSAQRFPGKLVYSILARGAVALYLALFIGSVAAAVYIWITTSKGLGVG